MRKRKTRKVDGISKLNSNRTRNFILIVIAFVFLGNAYSALNQTLILTGTATVLAKEEQEEHEIVQSNLNYITILVNPGYYEPSLGMYLYNSITFHVENPNDFDTTNWFANITIPGLIFSDDYKIEVDVAREIEIMGETISISNPEGSSPHAIIPGNGGLSADYSIRFTTTEAITYDNIIGYAYTIYDTYNADHQEFVKGNLKFVTNTSWELNWDGSYLTRLEMDITNQGNETITSYGLEMLYNSLSPNKEPSWIQCYQLGIADSTSEHVVFDSTIANNAISYTAYPSLEPGQSVHLEINRINTELKFRPVDLVNVWYNTESGSYDSTGSDTQNIIANNVINNTAIITNSLENIVLDTNMVANIPSKTNTTNTSEPTSSTNTVTNTTVDPVEPPVNPDEPDVPEIEGELSYACTYTSDEFNWGITVYQNTANVTIINPTDEPIEINGFDVTFLTPIMDAGQLQQIRCDKSFTKIDGSETLTSASFKFNEWEKASGANIIPAGGQLTFSILAMMTNEPFKGVVLNIK